MKMTTPTKPYSFRLMEKGILFTCYRFNVVRGLEDIGLEEAKKVKEMAAATRRYISSQEVHKQMQACAGSIAGREC
jgi:hypothetical protein